MINFLKPNEQPKADVVLQRMSEDGICLITGKRDNLTYLPVDLNVSNMLPSNMCCISKSFAEEECTFTNTYSFVYEDEFIVEFDTPASFLLYNMTILDALHTDEGMKKDFGLSNNPTPDEMRSGLVDVFEYLTAQHIKGIHSITSKQTYVQLGLKWNQYQQYLFHKLNKPKAESRIITPGLGLVK